VGGERAPAEAIRTGADPRSDPERPGSVRSGADALPTIPDGLSTPEPKPLRHLILLPTLNEEEGIRATLQELRSLAKFPGGRIPPVLVIDGGSIDATLSIAREFGCEILLQHGSGKGTAVRDGLNWAVQHGFSAVVALDADATYPGDRLPAAFRLLDEGFDVVIGVRRPDAPAPSNLRNMVHRVGNGFLGYCAARLSRGPILDVCSGFWGVRTERLPDLALESTGFEIESELFMKSFRRGLKICQIPIVYRKRLGTAKLHAVRDGFRIFLSILRHSGTAAGDPAPTLGLPARRRRTNPRSLAARHVPVVSLTALLLTLDPQTVVIARTSTRQKEADSLAGSLPLGSYSVRQETSPRDPNARVSPIVPWNPEDAVPFARPDQPVIVSLPDAPLDIEGLARIVVSVPGRPWVLSLGAPASGKLGAPPAPRRPPAAGRTTAPSPFPVPSSWSILAAVLDPSWAPKERALMGANVRAVGATVLPLLGLPARLLAPGDPSEAPEYRATIPPVSWE